MAKKPLLTRVFLRAFNVGLKVNVALTRSRAQWPEQRVLTPAFVRLTQALRGRREVEPTAAALGAEWERLLASRKTAHVTHVAPATGSTLETAYGEITIHCPLRGTGDVHACHRLMAYDRALVEAAGASSWCWTRRPSRGAPRAGSRFGARGRPRTTCCRRT